MFYKFKVPLIMIICGSLFFWIGSSFFNYFTYNIAPEIKLEGLQREGYYSGILNCRIKSETGYKVSDVSVFLDGKKFDCKNVASKKIDIPLEINTSDLTNGEHSLELCAVDSSYHKNKFKDIWKFNVDNVPLKSAFLQQEYKVDQGHTAHLKIQSNKSLAKAEIRFLDKIYNCHKESEHSNIYECFIPIDCELGAEDYLVHAELVDNVKNNCKLTSKLSIGLVNFPKQKGFTVSQGKLDEEKEISMSNRILEEALEKWMKDSPNQKMWSGKFEIPINLKKIATPFGEIRTTTEKGRYLHRAIDILDYPRSVVWASQNGKIIIKDRFYLTGNTVVIDHGLGVTTLYCHLEDFSDIEIGEVVKKGSPIGKIGMTGYATGYHLHWELRVNNIPVDPMEWTKKIF